MVADRSRRLAFKPDICEQEIRWPSKGLGAFAAFGTNNEVAATIEQSQVRIMTSGELRVGSETDKAGL